MEDIFGNGPLLHLAAYGISLGKWQRGIEGLDLANQWILDTLILTLSSTTRSNDLT